MFNLNRAQTLSLLLVGSLFIIAAFLLFMPGSQLYLGGRLPTQDTVTEVQSPPECDSVCDSSCAEFTGTEHTTCFNDCFNLCANAQ